VTIPQYPTVQGQGFLDAAGLTFHHLRVPLVRRRVIGRQLDRALEGRLRTLQVTFPAFALRVRRVRFPEVGVKAQCRFSGELAFCQPFFPW
jgi:hypothetical protein